MPDRVDRPPKPSSRADTGAGGHPAAPDERTISPTERSLSAIKVDLADLMAQLTEPTSARLRTEGAMASGGMGSVDVVVDPALRRRLARKRVLDHLQDEPKMLDLFVREARVTALLDHPGIVPVYEIGLDDEHQLYFTMKIVEGRTLSDHLHARGADVTDSRSLLDLLDIIVKVCDALAFAHSRGVAHCDVKPANVMVGPFGQVYVMDWGLAQSLGAPEEPGQKRILGTPAYMAPEQARGEQLGAHTDVFGVGALLYSALSNRAPFDASSVEESLEMATANQRIQWPAERHAGIPEGLMAIVQRAMSPRPDDRHGSMLELRDELISFMRGGRDLPRKAVAGGEHIVREGEAGEEVFILVEGTVEAYRTVNGEKVTLGTMHPGDVFGEMAILIDSPRTASVVALENCSLIVVTPELLEREIEGLEPWMASLTRALARRFREREEARLEADGPQER